MLSFISFVSGQEIETRGQIALQASPFVSSEIFYLKSGLNFFPEFTLSHQSSSDFYFDTEVSFKATASYFRNNIDTQFKLYRLKFRLLTDQSELRIGLQKINFGSAQLLRSLQWFDKLDPRDPLNLTDGVYGLRFKYNFLNNSELWFWTLYGNEESKGFDINKTHKDVPEFGGRFLYPLFDGEAAVTFHTRKADTGNFGYRENRYAFDGRWNLEIGLWNEIVLIQNNSENLPYKYQKLYTFGADYSINIGTTLMIIAEHMRSVSSHTVGGNEINADFTALSFGCLLGLIDNLNAIFYYSWDTKKIYPYFQWQRVYDDFIFSLGLFNYPSTQNFNMFGSSQAALAGYGATLTVIYNY